MAPVGQGSTQSPQYMHLPMSMSNRSMRSLGVIFPSPLRMSMLMTEMGQARSQAWHAVQMSMSTSRKPRYRAGMVSLTGTDIRSGYCEVIGFRNM